MSLNIKNPEAHTLAARLAKKTGETLTEAVVRSLRERLERPAEFDEERYRSLKALVKDSRRLWRDSLLSVDHGELLYDERGLPK
jgi:antitoxin VapB